MTKTCLMAASAVAMLSCAAAGAQAQTNPALVDLPAYLAYVAQHPTRLFGVEITSQARGYVSGALVSPAYGGGTRLDAWLNKSGHNLQADAGLQRDPRKLSSPDEVEAYARYDYGTQFTTGDIAYNGVPDTFQYKPPVGEVTLEHINPVNGPKRLYLQSKHTNTTSETYFTPRELANGDYRNLNSDTSLLGNYFSLTITNEDTVEYTLLHKDETHEDWRYREDHTHQLTYNDRLNHYQVDAHDNYNAEGEGTTYYGDPDEGGPQYDYEQRSVQSREISAERTYWERVAVGYRRTKYSSNDFWYDRKENYIEANLLAAKVEYRQVDYRQKDERNSWPPNRQPDVEQYGELKTRVLWTDLPRIRHTPADLTKILDAEITVGNSKYVVVGMSPVKQGRPPKVTQRFTPRGFAVGPIWLGLYDLSWEVDDEAHIYNFASIRVYPDENENTLDAHHETTQAHINVPQKRVQLQAAPVRPLSINFDSDAPTDLTLLSEGVFEYVNGQHNIELSTAPDMQQATYTYGREFKLGATLSNNTAASAEVYQAKVGMALINIDAEDMRADLLSPEGSTIGVDAFNAGGAGLVILEVQSPVLDTTTAIGKGAPASPTSAINFLKNQLP